ncbi:MAG TPA: YjbQ family protein [Desulfotomaculum sp.]|nr:YjbQ family protein [Desulfotomaculum sp.]
MITIEVVTQKRQEFVDITSRVQAAVGESGVSEGIAYLYCPHTTAGICINENYDPTVAEDVLNKLEELVPVSGAYRHAEGNAAAHIKSCLIGVTQPVLFSSGKLVLGTWQGVFFCEFDGPRRRRVLVRIIPAAQTA